MLATLQGDRRPDPRRLPFIGCGQPAHPMAPFLDRAILHAIQRRADIFRKALIWSQEEVQRLLDPEQALILDPADGCVGRKTHHPMIEQIADMVGAARGRCAGASPAGRRPQPDAHARRASHGPHNPHEGRWSIHPAAALETWREVRDFDCIAVSIDMASDQHWRVAQIGLRRFDGAVKIDFPKPISAIAGWGSIIEQGGKGWVAVDARQTCPHETAGAVDKCRHLTIADRPEIESRRHSASSHACTPATSSRRY